MKREKKNKQKQTEQRRYPRIEKAISMSLKGDHFSQVTKTKNISGSGAYCQVSEPLREFSKLDVILLVPVAKKGKANVEKIHCRGVVVRSERILCENGTPEKFFIAIYFTRLNSNDRLKLCRYISHQLTHGTL